MMAASDEGHQKQQEQHEQQHQQHVQFLLVHQGQVIGTATHGMQLQIQQAVEHGQITTTTLPSSSSDAQPTQLAILQLTGDGHDQVVAEEEARTSTADAHDLDDNSTVVIQCVEAGDDGAYVECIGLDIDPNQEANDPGGCEEVAGLQESLISMKNNDDNNNDEKKMRSLLIPKSNNDGHDNQDDNVVVVASDSSSVLRTLLQANRRQIMTYQMNKTCVDRIPFRGGRTTYSRQQRVPQHHQLQDDVDTMQQEPRVVSAHDEVSDLSVNESELRTSVAQIIEEETEVADSPEVVISQTINSPIKALLLGQNYIREDRLPLNLTTSSGSSATTTTTKTTMPAHSIVRHRAANFGDNLSTQKAKKPRSYLRSTEQDDECLFQPLFSEVIKVVEEFSDLNCSVQYGHRYKFIEICRKGLYGIPWPGQTPVKVIVSDHGVGQFVSVIGLIDQVDCELREQNGPSVAERLRPLLHKLSIQSGHVYCPGVDHDLSDSVPPSILQGMCRVNGWSMTSKLYRSNDCQVWHSLIQDKDGQRKWLALNEGVHKCDNCRRLELYLRTIRKKKVVPSQSISLATTTTIPATFASESTDIVSTAGRRSPMGERTTAIDLQTGEEFICIWDTTQDMEIG